MTQHRAGCSAFRADAAELEGKPDSKLAALVKSVKELLADGYDPIVFCRFIDTAEYVAEHLGAALGKNVTVRAVTGTLPPPSGSPGSTSSAAIPGQPRPGRHRLPLRGRQPAGELPGRRPLRPGLEPHPPRAAGGPRRPLRAARADMCARSRSTAATTRSTASCSTSCSASTRRSARRPASRCRSPTTVRPSSRR